MALIAGAPTTQEIANNSQIKFKYKSPEYKALEAKYMSQGVDANTLKSIANQVNKELKDPNLTITLLGKHYDSLVSKMIKAGYTAEQIAGDIVKFEKKARTIHGRNGCDFGQLGYEMTMMRNWLAGVVDSQIKSGIIKLDNSKGVVAQTKIGRDQLKILLDVLGVSAIRITKQAFDYLFGDQSGSYDFETDSLSLEDFVNELKNEVLVFAGTMSPYKLNKMLSLFAAKKFVLIKDNEIGNHVKTVLLDLVKGNLKAEEAINKGDLEGLAEALKASEALKDYAGSIMLQHMTEAKKQIVSHKVREKGVTEKAEIEKLFELTSEEIAKMYAYAGLAVLWSDHQAGSIKTHLEQNNGDKRVLYDIDIKNAAVAKALFALITDVGLRGFDNITTFKPGSTVKEHVDWLNTKRDWPLSWVPQFIWPRDNSRIEKAVENADKASMSAVPKNAAKVEGPPKTEAPTQPENPAQ
ncbi:hypothetical protein ACFLZ2_03785 [Candidatus Margulisiibacteriota bacterium]